jgi:hypothetical protein
MFILASIGGLLAFKKNSENIARTITGQINYYSTTTTTQGQIIDCCYPKQTDIPCGHTTHDNLYWYWNGTMWVLIPNGIILYKCA